MMKWSGPATIFSPVIDARSRTPRKTMGSRSAILAAKNAQFRAQRFAGDSPNRRDVSAGNAGSASMAIYSIARIGPRTGSHLSGGWWRSASSTQADATRARNPRHRAGDSNHGPGGASGTRLRHSQSASRNAPRQKTVAWRRQLRRTYQSSALHSASHSE